MSNHLETPFRSLAAIPIAVLLISGSIVVVRGWSAAVEPLTTVPIQASADLSDHAADVDCPPNLAISAIGSSPSSGQAGQPQADYCSTGSGPMLPLIPEDPCPDPEPCRPSQFWGSNGTNQGFGNGSGMLWILTNFFASLRERDHAPIEPDEESYEDEKVLRVKLLDSPFIDVSSGRLARIEQDLFLPGAGLDFALTRFYSSDLADYPSAYGAGWELNVHRRVIVRAYDDVYPFAPEEIQLVTGAGHPTGKYYDLDHDGWFVNSARQDLFSFSNSGGTKSFTHYLPNGLIERYDQKSTTEDWFYIVRAENQFGVATTFTYRNNNSACPTEWCLDYATDSVGRTIHFDYSDTTGLLLAVTVLVGSQVTAQVDYEYTDPGSNKPWLLTKVTGLEVATLDTQGSGMSLQRLIHEYDYWFDSSAGAYGEYLLSGFRNALDQAQHEWSYYSNSGGMVHTQTDRADTTPLRAPAVHTYAYSSGLTTYTGPEGEQREWLLDGGGRIEQLRELVDAGNSVWAETDYTYDSSCSGCPRVTRIDFEDARAIEVQYDAGGNPTAIWHYPDPNSGAPTRVERFTWAIFDPADLLLPSGVVEPITRLLKHEQIRDTVENEGPTSNCNHPECGDQYNADGWIMHTYSWNTNKKTVSAIDYGDIQKANGGVTLLMNRREEFTYHSDGRIASRTELEEYNEVVKTEFDLDSSGNFLETVTMTDLVNSGTWETVFARDEFGWAVLVGHPDGTVTALFRDGAGRVWRTVEGYQSGPQSGARTTDTLYDREGRLVYKKVTAGTLTYKAEYDLDETGMPIAVTTTGPGGPARTMTIEISPGGRLSTVTDWRGLEKGTEYGKGAWQLPIRRWEKFGSTERTIWQSGINSSDEGYDEMGRLTGWRNAAGWPTSVVYDGLGRRQEVFTQTDSTHVAGRHYNYDARGFLNEMEVGMTTGTTDNPSIGGLSWNEHHVFVNNLAGHRIAWALYEGNASVPSRMQRYQVDWRGRPEVILDYQGNRASGLSAAVPIARDFVWDGMDRLLREQDYESWELQTIAESTVYDHDDAQRQIEVVLSEAGGAYQEKARTQLDELGRMTSITEWEWTGSAWGNSRTFVHEWDGLDRQTAVEDSLGKRCNWEYDDLNRLVEETIVPYDSSASQITTWTYDSGHGQLASITDAEGKVTDLEYYTSGAAFLMPKKTTYADGRWKQVFAYDALRRATQVGDSRGVVRDLLYDGIYLIEDDSNLETLIAGSDNHVAGADEMRWTYDRLTGYLTASKLLLGGTEVWRTEYDYNKVGELESEIQGPLNDSNNPRHTWSWTRGFGGELLSVGYPGGFGIGAGSLTWDAAGRLEAMEYTKSSSTLADYLFEYDGMRLAKRTEQVSSIELDYGYDTWNRQTGMTWSKGSTTFDGQERSFDLGNRVIARKRAMDSTGEVFSHDGHHRMTKWWQGVSSPLSWTGQADPSTWSKVERYSLNKVFARSQTQQEVNGGSTTTTNYGPNDAHFYTSVGSESRSSHHGFMNGDGTFYYRWDAWGRLIEVRDASSGTLRRSHLYDCEGRRVRTVEYASSGTQQRKTRYVFWGSGLAASYEGTGANIRTYGFAGGSDGESFVKVEQAGSANGTYELAREFQGTILALIQRTNPSSVSVVERYRYEPFGSVAIEDGAGQTLSASAFKNERFFLGRVWDQEVGIYDIRARWYEPNTGAFLAPDPLGAIDSWNFYQYSLSGPATFADPTGEKVYAIDGSNSKRRVNADCLCGCHKEANRSFVFNFASDVCDEVVYFHGPGTLGLDTDDIHNAVLNQIREDRKKNPNEPIILIGHSRGGHICMEIARALQEDNVKVDFVGVFDPVDMTLGYGSWSETMPDNVVVSATAYGDGRSRWWFNTVDGGSENNSPTHYEGQFDGATHAGIGGDSWGGDHPDGMSASEDASQSAAAETFVRDAAKSAGVTFH